MRVQLRSGRLHAGGDDALCSQEECLPGVGDDSMSLQQGPEMMVKIALVMLRVILSHVGCWSLPNSISEIADFLASNVGPSASDRLENLTFREIAPEGPQLARVWNELMLLMSKKRQVFARNIE